MALPNLLLPDPSAVPGRRSGLAAFDLAYTGLTLGSEHVAIVHPADPRVVEPLARSPGLRKLIDGFRDEAGDPMQPALLLVRRRAPGGIRFEALTAFRNALALATILRARVHSVTSGSNWGPRWADTFDFYPAQVGSDGELHFRSAAAVMIGALRGPLHATTAPYLHVQQEHLLSDAYLHRALGEAWRARYERPRAATDWHGIALFRSLELAYAAAAVPIRNAGSLIDYGTQIGLWVSALEVLVRTETTKSSENRVRTLLDAAPWYGGIQPKTWVQRKQYVMKSNRPAKGGTLKEVRTWVTPAGKVLASLYTARHDFQHGNPVRWKTLLPWGKVRGQNGATLPNAAAVLYRIALHAFLIEHYPSGRLDGDSPDMMRDMADDMECASALALMLRGPNAGDLD
jgi:hypothetical protein